MMILVVRFRQILVAPDQHFLTLSCAQCRAQSSGCVPSPA